MDGDLYAACSKLLASKTYIQQASDSKNARKKLLRTLLEQRRLLDEPLDDLSINLFLEELSAMDSNNFSGNCGVGEREGRIYSKIVAQRHFWMSHGIGRSGSLVDVQPKAAGSSICSKLTNALALHVIRDVCGIRSTASCFVVPMATGMTLTLCMLTLRQQRKQARFVIWSRIDQKSAFKCILTAGFEPIVIEGTIHGDEIRTNLDAIDHAILEHGPDSILCVLSTTSCFAPRAFDSLVEIGTICAKYNVPHVVNNAYGLQSSKACHLIETTHKSKGRIDCFVQSTDKNFMVPVGGAIVAGFDERFVQEIADMYPGRASAVPSTDLLITFLSLGRSGIENLLKERKKLFGELKKSLTSLASRHGLQILNTPGNNISVGVAFPTSNTNENSSPKNNLTAIGAKLFMRCVSGCRVVPVAVRQQICGTEFVGWGAHSSVYPSAYLTAAGAIGMVQNDIDLFVNRLDRLLKDEAKGEEKEQSNNTNNVENECDKSAND